MRTHLRIADPFCLYLNLDEVLGIHTEPVSRVSFLPALRGYGTGFPAGGNPCSHPGCFPRIPCLYAFLRLCLLYVCSGSRTGYPFPLPRPRNPRDGCRIPACFLRTGFPCHLAPAPNRLTHFPGFPDGFDSPGMYFVLFPYQREPPI